MTTESRIVSESTHKKLAEDSLLEKLAQSINKKQGEVLPLSIDCFLEFMTPQQMLLELQLVGVEIEKDLSVYLLMY